MIKIEAGNCLTEGSPMEILFDVANFYMSLDQDERLTAIASFVTTTMLEFKIKRKMKVDFSKEETQEEFAKELLKEIDKMHEFVTEHKEGEEEVEEHVFS